MDITRELCRFRHQEVAGRYPGHREMRRLLWEVYTILRHWPGGASFITKGLWRGSRMRRMKDEFNTSTLNLGASVWVCVDLAACVCECVCMCVYICIYINIYYIYIYIQVEHPSSKNLSSEMLQIPKPIEGQREISDFMPWNLVSYTELYFCHACKGV